MPDESINPTTTPNNSLAPSYFGNETKIIFDGSCLKLDKITFTFTQEKTVNIYMLYETNLWNYVDSSDPMLRNSLLGAVK